MKRIGSRRMKLAILTTATTALRMEGNQGLKVLMLGCVRHGEFLNI
jgi:hypothetical protein